MSPSMSSDAESRQVAAGMHSADDAARPSMMSVSRSCMRGKLPMKRVMTKAASAAATAPATRNTQSARASKLETDAERLNTIQARHKPNPAMTIR